VFFGGGSVGLSAKALGFGIVEANDLAERSAVVGRALLANGTHLLQPLSVLSLFDAPPAAEESQPKILWRLPAASRAFFEKAWRHLRYGDHSPIERDLLTTLILKPLVASFPMGLPTASDAQHAVSGDFDRETPRLVHYLQRGRALVRPRHLLQAAADINKALLPGNARMHQDDAFAFLARVEGDVVYVDPPYGGTQSYERAFSLIDEYLGAQPPPQSAFSSRRPPLDELLDACRRIPVLVFSLNNVLLDEEALRALIGRHRRVDRFLSIPYRHYGAVATEGKNRSNREFLVLATLQTREARSG
jgi:hypothetical protein